MVAQRSITSFDEKVYKVCSEIPKGKVCTYKDLAIKIGSPKAFRAVGSALRKNPFAPLGVPCHRVIASSRLLGGFHGSKDPNGEDLKRKQKMLREEGVTFEQSDLVKVAVESVHHFT